MSIPKQVWDTIQAQIKAMKEFDFERAMQLKIVAFVHTIGCDASDEWNFEYEDNNIPFDTFYKRIKKDMRFIHAAKRLDIKALALKYGAADVDATGTSYGGWRFEGAALENLMQHINKEVIKRNQEAAAKKQAEQERKKQREIARKQFVVEIIEVSHTAGGEGGADPDAKVRLTDPKTNESAIFTCRNIFDFGYVVNPEGGGLALNVEKFIETNSISYKSEKDRIRFRESHPTKTGWGWDRMKKGWLPMSDFEIRAVKYLGEFPPIDSSIRM
jgi:hypothetical protein